MLHKFVDRDPGKSIMTADDQILLPLWDTETAWMQTNIPNMTGNTKRRFMLTIRSEDKEI